MRPSYNDPRPEIQEDIHRPQGRPTGRESKSQQAQLKSDLDHGEIKEIKDSGRMNTPTHRDGYDRPEKAYRLTQSIQRILNNDKDLRSYDLKGEVTGAGVARVSGIVDTLIEKEHIDDILDGISGVRKIENAVSISTDGYVDDGEVKMEVAQEIAGDSHIETQPDIDVEKGKVTLSGDMPDPDQKKAAVKAAAKARGVVDVFDNMKVKDGIDLNDPDEIFHSQVRNDREK